MRHLMLALMIVLLPLRGWAGDAMATGMAMDRAGAASMSAQSVAQHDHAQHDNNTHAEATTAQSGHAAPATHAAQSLHDCGGQSAQDQIASEGATAHDDHCSTCGSCQACHTVALSPAAHRLNTLFGTPAHGHDLAASYTSASPALGQKPPIS